MSCVANITFERVFKECVNITGTRQTGKTKLLIYLIKHNPNPLFIFDSLGVISQAIANGELTLRPRQYITNPNWTIDTLPPYDELERKHLKLPEGTPTRLSVFLPWCKQVWQHDYCIAIVEEWHLFCQRKWALPSQFGSLFNQAGNKNIAVWGTSQAPAQCHNDMLRACRHHIIFSLWMPPDLAFLRQFIPKKFVYAPEEEGEPVPNSSIDTLEPYYYFYYDALRKKGAFLQPISI